MANLTKLEEHLATRSYIEGYVVLFPILFFVEFFAIDRAPMGGWPKRTWKDAAFWYRKHACHALGDLQDPSIRASPPRLSAQR